MNHNHPPTHLSFQTQIPRHVWIEAARKLLSSQPQCWIRKRRFILFPRHPRRAAKSPTTAVKAPDGFEFLSFPGQLQLRAYTYGSLQAIWRTHWETQLPSSGTRKNKGWLYIHNFGVCLEFEGFPIICEREDLLKWNCFGSACLRESCSWAEHDRNLQLG